MKMKNAGVRGAKGSYFSEKRLRVGEDLSPRPSLQGRELSVEGFNDFTRQQRRMGRLIL